MKYEEALAIVLDLAIQNALEVDDCDGDENLLESQKTQQTALDVVADMINDVDWQFVGGPD